MSLKGTYIPNRVRVTKQTPDCLVYLNGELSLPSGATPNRRINIQPYISSVSVTAQVSAPPATAQVSMQIPKHLNDNLRRGGRLIITPMMEVRIYAKGNYLLNGAPQYYPIFWGVIRDVNENYSGGENTVDFSCEDMTYWWKVQHVNVNPSALALENNHAANLSVEGNIFTGMNAFQILYTLARQVHGDGVLASLYAEDFQVFSEATDTEQLNLMAYWAKRWSRLSTALRMYGPNGRILVGDALSAAIKQNYIPSSGDGERGKATTREGTKFVPPDYDFSFGSIDLRTVSPFTLETGKIGSSLDVYNSELQTKLQLAQQVAETIGYEFYMDVTGELIFKPPFYNVDVQPNFPISWIRDIDIISEGYTEQPPDATYIDGTGDFIQSIDIGVGGSPIIPRATYIDYRLVQKYGWIRTDLNVQHIGNFEDGQGNVSGGPQALFSHLVDQLDKVNMRSRSGNVTIPFRPELRLGYPIYHQSRDAYYYVESISHSFAFKGQCTTSLSLMAERSKFYAPYRTWEVGQGEPAPGSVANPDVIPRNLYARPTDPVSGFPVGDRNIVLTFIPGAKSDPIQPRKTDDERKALYSSRSEELKYRVTAMSSQFAPITNAAEFVYQVDPARDNPFTPVPGAYRGIRRPGELSTVTQLTPRKVQGRDTFVFPVSDERGYDHFGGYEYGRSVSIQNSSLQLVTNDFISVDKAKAYSLTFLSPDIDDGEPNLTQEPDKLLANSIPNVSKNYETTLSPTNYGRLLEEIAPEDDPSDNLPLDSRKLLDGINFKAPTTNRTPSPVGAGSTPFASGNAPTGEEFLQDPSGLPQRTTKDGRVVYRVGKREFSYSSNVERWRGDIQAARANQGLSDNFLPDDLMLAFIHVESQGNPAARRNTPSGKPSQFNGLLQMGTAAAADIGIQGGSDSLQGDGPAALNAFFQIQKKYSRTTKNDNIAKIILWARGVTPAKNYLALRQQGLSEAEALDHPNVAKYNAKIYIDKIRAARQVWLNREASPTAPVSDEAQDPNVKPEETISKEEEIPNFALLEQEEQATQNKLFLNALATNVDRNALPANILPPRDPSILEPLNEFLLELYARAFSENSEEERVLRGQNIISKKDRA